MSEAAVRIEHVSALVFRVMGVRLGFDTEQIYGMTDVRKLDQSSVKLLAVHQLLGLEVSDFVDDDGAEAKKAIFVKGAFYPAGRSQENWRVAVVVGEPEEIVDIPVAVMRPMPSVIAPRGDLHGLWAAALLPDEMVFMMDVQKAVSRMLCRMSVGDEGA